MTGRARFGGVSFAGCFLPQPDDLLAEFGGKVADHPRQPREQAVDPLHTSEGKRGLSRGGYGTEEIWTEFSRRPDRVKLIASATASQPS